MLDKSILPDIDMAVTGVWGIFPRPGSNVRSREG